MYGMYISIFPAIVPVGKDTVQMSSGSLAKYPWPTLHYDTDSAQRSAMRGGRA